VAALLVAEPQAATLEPGVVEAAALVAEEQAVAGMMVVEVAVTTVGAEEATTVVEVAVETAELPLLIST